jgi:hypothetical protein
MLISSLFITEVPCACAALTTFLGRGEYFLRINNSVGHYIVDTHFARCFEKRKHLKAWH